MVARPSTSAFTRGLAALLAVTSVLQLRVASSAPADIFSIPAPVIGADAPKSADIKSGDATVSTQTGALSWSYPIAVPPGRGGAAPSGLALSYSSQAPIYGGIAAGFGWNLGVPEIREDPSEGRLKTHLGLLDLIVPYADADDRFVGPGNRRLVPVDDPKGSDVYMTYRAQADDSFQRFERLSGVPHWRARSTDGSIMEFGGTTAACSNVSEGYAPLTRSLDVFGNSITYNYEEAISGECRLKSIEWGANANASLQNFARVELVWDSAPPSCAGIFVGSQLDYRTGAKIITGASLLDKIRVTAFEPGLPSSPVHTREITLAYKTEFMACDREHSPLKLLMSLQESAWRANDPAVTLPAVTLEYGDPTVVFPHAEKENVPWTYDPTVLGMNRNLAWGYRYPAGSDDVLDRSPTVEAMLVDLDGDGLVDRLVNDSTETVDGECRASWEKNRGAGADFGGPFPITLPRLKWRGPGLTPPSEGSGIADATTYGEKCSLAGQVTAYKNSNSAPGCHEKDGTTACHSAADPRDQTLYCGEYGRECAASTTPVDDRTYLYYRWIDADGDGLTDLVAAVHGDVRRYDIEQGNGDNPLDPPPDPEPELFGPWPDCPQIDRCKDVTDDCIKAAGDDPEAIQACIDDAPTVPCDHLISAPDGAAGSFNRGPYTRCEGLYPWFIFRNQGNGQFDNPTIKYQPIPLESDMGDSSLGGSQVVSQHHGVLDFDGDGVLDAVVKPRNVAGHFWWVWFGDRTGGFEPRRYWFLSRPNGLVSQTSASPAIASYSTGGLIDLNGDGAPDHWQEINGQGNANVWLNTGTEHSTSTSINTPYLPGAFTVKPGNDTSHEFPPGGAACVTMPSPSCTYYSGVTNAKARVFDVDQDGRLDVVQADPVKQEAKVFFNAGGQFIAPSVAFPRVTGAGPNIRGVTRHTVVDGSQGPDVGTWMLEGDHVDLDGDGIPEVVYFEGGEFNRAKQVNIQPPRLLVSVDNGRGAHVSVEYASMHEDTAVKQNPALDPDDASTFWLDHWNRKRPNASPRAQWVVKSLTSTDAFSNTTSTTSYLYKNPRYGADDEGKYSFRGFGEVVTTGPSGASTINRYGYDVDWSGRLVETLVMPSSGEMTVEDEVRSITKVTWEARTLFGGALETYHATVTEHFTCINGHSEAACKASPAMRIPGIVVPDMPGYTRVTTTLTELPVGSSQPLAWVPSASLRQAGTPGAPDADGDRRTETMYAFRSEPDFYRLRPLVTEQRVRVGGNMKLFAKSASTWDIEYRVKLTDEVWFDEDDNHRAITHYESDPATGNLKKRWKPKQWAEDKYTSFEYDSRQLFIATEINERGYRLDSTYEYGTGAKLMTEGPNQRTCTTGCPLDPTHPANEQHMIVVDGLGRTLQTWDTVSDDGSQYELVQRSSTSYADVPTATASAAVTNHVRLDMTSGVWTEDVTEFDAHGRPIKRTSDAGTTAPADPVTTYTYRNDGSLEKVEVPDPTQNSIARVAYKYTFDSLGRPTSMRRPDAINAVPNTIDQTGVDINYNGVSRTSTEVLDSQLGQAAKTRTTMDDFGRIALTEEYTDSSTTVGTKYKYDGNDNVTEITDFEGHLTKLDHDFAGHRTKVTRAGRAWNFTYDKNGNLETEEVPGSSSAATDLAYRTSITYDELDRPISKLIGQRTLSPDDQALFGDFTETFTWDDGANMIGQLRYWKSFAPGASNPTIVIDTLNQGQLITQIQKLRVADYPELERRFGLRYALFGGVSETRFEDAIGGTNNTTATTEYDARGLPWRMVLKRTGEADRVLAVQTRNVAGLVTNRRTDTMTLMPYVQSDWTYDRLGRIRSQDVTKGPSPMDRVVRQDLSYFGNDDPRTLTHHLGTVPKTFTFGYDPRHQLATVSTATSGYFDATYEYSAGGRLKHVVVAQTITPPPAGTEVEPRDVRYVYGDADPERLTALTNVGNGTIYAGYSYDEAGNTTRRCYGGSGVPTCAGELIEFVYDGKDQLRRATKKLNGVAQGSEEYWYGNSGQRVAVVKRDAAGTKTEMIWFIGDTEAHYDGVGNITDIYSHLSLGTPVARVDRTSNTATAVEYLFHGLASSTIAAVAEDGTINASFSYAPFGEVIEATNGGGVAAGTAAHKRRMNDKFVDDVSDLAYYGARYYDKISMGWTQSDPLYQVGHDLAMLTTPRRANLFQFSLNNPLRYMDPDGLDSKPTFCWDSPGGCSITNDGPAVTQYGGKSDYTITTEGSTVTDCGILGPGACGAVMEGETATLRADGTVSVGASGTTMAAVVKAYGGVNAQIDGIRHEDENGNYLPIGHGLKPNDRGMMVMGTAFGIVVAGGLIGRVGWAIVGWATAESVAASPGAAAVFSFVAKNGDKINQQILRWSKAFNVVLKGTSFLERQSMFMAHASNLARTATAAGTYVTGRVGALQSATIFRSGSEYLLIYQNAIMSYVPNATAGEGIAAVYKALGGI